MASDNEPNSSGLMDKCLALSFPFWLIELKDKPIEYLQKRAGVCSQAIAEKGDVLMYGSKKKGAAGEVFNRLAEGMACLCLITKHPVPFNKQVFLYDGTIETFETEKEANDKVWPSVPDLPKENYGALQSKAVQGLCGDASETAGAHSDGSAADGGKTPGGDADAT